MVKLDRYISNNMINATAVEMLLCIYYECYKYPPHHHHHPVQRYGDGARVGVSLSNAYTTLP
jgi:hypothetical protein